MRRQTRVGLAIMLTMWLCAGSVIGQDPIDVDLDTGDNYIELSEVGGSGRPGRTNEIRDDVVNLTYKIYADIDPEVPGDEEVYKVVYAVTSISSPVNNVNEIYRGADNKLRFKVGANQLTTTCDHTKTPAQGGCAGSGMPIELYGALVGQLQAFATAESTGVSVTSVKLRQAP